MKGQVPASTLAAHRRAGADIPALLEDAIGELGDPWRGAERHQIATLCAWNAYVCQTVANALVDAESYEDSTTAGYLPPRLAGDALVLYREAESWRTQAIQARTSKSFMLDARAPDTFPLRIDPLLGGASVPRGLLWSLQAIVTRRDAFERAVSTAPAEQWEAAGVLQELFGAVQSAGDYAARMWSDSMPSDVRAEVAERLRSAIANAYVLGELAAMPQLAESKAELGRTLEANRVRHERAALDRRSRL